MLPANPSALGDCFGLHAGRPVPCMPDGQPLASRYAAGCCACSRSAGSFFRKLSSSSVDDPLDIELADDPKALEHCFRLHAGRPVSCMPDGPPLGCRNAARCWARSQSVSLFVYCRARPSSIRWIVSFSLIRQLSPIVFDCMPDGPFGACRTARVLDRCWRTQQSRKHYTALALLEHIPPIVFARKFIFRTPAVKRDEIVHSACRTARLACRTARRSDAAAPLAVGQAASPSVPTLTDELVRRR